MHTALSGGAAGIAAPLVVYVGDPVGAVMRSSGQGTVDMDDDQKSPASGPQEQESTTGSDSWAEYMKRVHAGPGLPPAALDEAARERIEDPEGVDIAEGIHRYGTSSSMTPADARALSDRMLEELLLRHVDPDLAAVLRAEARRRSDGLPDWFMEETT